MSNAPRDGFPNYDIYGAAVAEVELDVLTGEKTVRRADIMADVGNSMRSYKYIF